jgi:ABC-type taurine transport system substrate-binding protein
MSLWYHALGCLRRTGDSEYDGYSGCGDADRSFSWKPATPDIEDRACQNILGIQEACDWRCFVSVISVIACLLSGAVEVVYHS